MPPTAVFVTCTRKGPVKEHPKQVVVLQTGPDGTVLTNQNDPDEAAKVLAQAKKFIAGDNSPEDSTKMKPNQPFFATVVGCCLTRRQEADDEGGHHWEETSGVACRGTIQGKST